MAAKHINLVLLASYFVLCLFLATFTNAQALINVEQPDDTPKAVNLVNEKSVREQGVVDLVDNLKPNEPYEEFIPTHEWQIIGKNQPIPPGLHVSINFQTGERMAKLLEPEGQEQNSEIVSVAVDQKEGNEGERSKGAIEEKEEEEAEEEDEVVPAGLIDQETGESHLANANRGRKYKKKGIHTLSEKKKEKLDILNDLINSTVDKFDLNKYNENSDVKIKDFSAEIDNTWKTNSASPENINILRMQLAQLTGMDKMKEVDLFEALDQLEELLEEYDNAIEFLRMDGDRVLVDLLDHESDKIKTKVCLILGAFCQNNMHVREGLFNEFVIEKLLHLLNTTTTFETRLRAIFPLSTLFSYHPYTTSRFLSEKGENVFLSLIETGFGKNVSSEFMKSNQLSDKQLFKIRVKALNFIKEFIIDMNLQDLSRDREQEDRVEMLKMFSQDKTETLKLYGPKFMNAKICAIIFSLLNENNISDSERVMETILLFSEECSSSLKDSISYQQVLDRIAKEWGEGDDPYNVQIAKLIEAIRF